MPRPPRGVVGNDNETRLPRAFEAAGWDVVCFDRESLAAHDGGVFAESLAGCTVAVDGFELYCQLGFGTQASFLDRMQMLRTLDQRRFVNTPDALVYQHGKISLLLACPDVPQPASHLGNDPDKLAAVIRAGGDWDREARRIEFRSVTCSACIAATPIPTPCSST